MLSHALSVTATVISFPAPRSRQNRRMNGMRFSFRRTFVSIALVRIAYRSVVALNIVTTAASIIRWSTATLPARQIHRSTMRVLRKSSPSPVWPYLSTFLVQIVRWHMYFVDCSQPITHISVLLVTAQIFIVTANGHTVWACTLLDQSSEVSFMRESLAQYLPLWRYRAYLAIHGIGAQRTCTTRGKMSLCLRSCLEPSFECDVEVFILLSWRDNYLPSQSIFHRGRTYRI